MNNDDDHVDGNDFIMTMISMCVLGSFPPQFSIARESVQSKYHIRVVAALQRHLDSIWMSRDNGSATSSVISTVDNNNDDDDGQQVCSKPQLSADNGDSTSSSLFRIENEFSGLHAVFPIDAAVYRGDRLLAFLEVDGETHFTYDIRGQKQLRRIDKLKMFLYRNRFPSIPIYRVNVEDSNKYGVDAVCRELAMSIYQSG